VILDTADTPQVFLAIKRKVMNEVEDAQADVQSPGMRISLSRWDAGRPGRSVSNGAKAFLRQYENLDVVFSAAGGEQPSRGNC
jgi:hypothetical protein